MGSVSDPATEPAAPAAPHPPDTRPQRGDELELTIDALAYGGRGVARDGGYVVFVDGGFPGDRVRAVVTKRKRRFAEAQLIELIEAGPERVPYDGEPCPGAPWAELAYDRQLAHKHDQVRDALERIGHLSDFDLRPIEPALEQWGYRNKFEFAFGEQEDGTLALGFHERGSWERVTNSVDCPLASTAIDAARNRIREWAVEHDLTAYDRRDRTGILRYLVVREGRRTGQIQTRLVISAGSSIPAPPVDLLTALEGDAGGTEGATELLGTEHLEEELHGLRFRISPWAFFQTNTEMAERLYSIAADAAELTGSERVYDLFCGIGTIGLTLADRAKEVWGLELVPEAVHGAGLGAELNGITNAKFRAGSARTGLRPLVEEAGTPDLVIVDPPRAGLGAKVVRRVIECEAARIVYVSCNPTTLAPDAAQFAEAGYRLTRITPVDMFPQTPHIEAVAVLEHI